MVKKSQLIYTVFCGLMLYTISLQAQKNAYPANISDADKLYGLSLFWQEANYNFAFFHQVPTLHWDSAYQAYIPKVLATRSTKAYYDVLRRFCALLKDGHTRILYPDEVRKQFSDIKIKWLPFKHRAFVGNIDQKLVKRIPLGTELLAVNGQPLKNYLKEKVLPQIFSSTEHVLWDWGIRSMFYGPKGDRFRLILKTPQGQIKKITLTRNDTEVKWLKPLSQAPILQFKWLHKQIAYLAINTFNDEKLQTQFSQHLPALYKAKGIIIDIRKNGGGSTSNASFIVKHFTEKKILTGALWQTREHRSVFKVWGSLVKQKLEQNKSMLLNRWEKNALKYYQKKAWYTGDTMQTQNHINVPKITVPLVVLTSHQTASAAEDFLIYLDNIQRAIRVGQRTNGSTGQPLTFRLPGGGMAYICVKKDTYLDGREFVGYGIAPHITINPGIESYLHGQDLTLAKGIEVLKNKIKAHK